MKRDNFLLGILAGIGILVILALGLFFVRQDNLTYTAGKTPDEVIQNYVVAVHKKDYEKAYSYLAELQYKPTYDQFKTAFLDRTIDPASAGIELGESDISGDNANVEVGVLFNPGDPFSGGYRNTEYGLLVKQGGEWKIKQLPYTLWAYDWYTESMKWIK